MSTTDHDIALQHLDMRQSLSMRGLIDSLDIAEKCQNVIEVEDTVGTWNSSALEVPGFEAELHQFSLYLQVDILETRNLTRPQATSKC